MNNTQQLKKCLNTIIELWDEYVSEPVIQMIYDFAREPICGDGDNMSLVNGCKKKNPLCHNNFKNRTCYNQ